MEKAFSLVTGFLGGLATLFLATIPVTILWQVLTGTSCFGMDVISNLTEIINHFGTSGFVGLVALVIIMSFFVKK